jgi:hypothetical protein
VLTEVGDAFQRHSHIYRSRYVFCRDPKPADRWVITKRGEFRAESTRIDLHRLWMRRFDERLPRIIRITPSGKRSLILFATDPDQPKMQVSGIETSQDQIPVFGLDWPYYLRYASGARNETHNF